LKPYWGKPTVRDFRGGDGNVGIIRSPVRAIALLDHSFVGICRQRGLPDRSDGGALLARFERPRWPAPTLE
jgi:hypothetical protein